MADPAKKYDEAHVERDPRQVFEDPINPVPPLGADARTPEPRYAANDPQRVETRIIETDRGGGAGLLAVAIVVVLGVIAYFLFATGAPNNPAAPEQPAATAPATPDSTAPDASFTTPGASDHAPAAQDAAPAAGADQAPGQPETSAPAEPAPAQ